MREIDAITRFVTDTPLFVTAEIISPLLLKAAVRVFHAQGRLLQRNMSRKTCLRFAFYLRQIVCYIKHKKSFARRCCSPARIERVGPAQPVRRMQRQLNRFTGGIS